MSFVGRSEKIKNVLRISMRAASYKNMNALITGERYRKRDSCKYYSFFKYSKKKNFVAINCSSSPDSLVES